MLNSDDKGFPKRWVTISESNCTRAQIDHWIRQGLVWTLIIGNGHGGSEAYYSADQIDALLANDAYERLGGTLTPQEKAAGGQPLPTCNKTGNLHR